ncbi:MAG: cytochrome C [Bacteroidetes bacterium]|nr:cytochrome C [Pseudopedobacter sp.]MBU0695936.1 cytochrome C [Bacteroidota bacterium]MBU1373286.1 cytochrome C [Bacteroidota bacterium]MBU1484222.1 cytochrome C [Bacteroidota bacterium]MBU1760530.1 cytochrome C [Bacteroidota bacterium]
MKSKSLVTLFIDDELQPIGSFPTPVSFELDTRKLTDGQHTLKIVSKDQNGKEGLKLIPFTVRNGPAIAIEGLKKDEVVDGIVPLMINAYGKGNQTSFVLHGSETPHSIPIWIIILLILFIGWATFYVITSGAIALF